MDPESLLPVPPPGFKRFPWSRRKRSKLGEAYRRLLTGYRGEVQALWTCDNPASNTKVLEIFIRFYDHPRSARAQFNPIRVVKKMGKRAAGITPTVTDDGSYQLVWNRGNIHFLEIAGRHEQAVVSCDIVAIDNPPELEELGSLYAETIGNLPQPTARRGIPLLVRQVAFGVVLAAAIFLTTELAAAFFGDAAGLPVFVALIFSVILFSAIPGVAVRRAARRAARYGSTDEGIPLALASVGVTYPTENDI